MAKVNSLLKNPLGGHFRLRRGTKYDDFGPLEPDLGLLSAHYQLNADFFNRLSSLDRTRTDGQFRRYGRPTFAPIYRRPRWIGCFGTRGTAEIPRQHIYRPIPDYHARTSIDGSSTGEIVGHAGLVARTRG